jgi:hypothetical protein
LYLFSILALLGVPSVPAQSAEATVFAGVAQIRNGDIGAFGLGAQEIQLSDGTRFGARLSLSSGPLTGHELTYAYERHDLEIASAKESEARTHEFAYNFVLHLTPRASALRPFVTVGAGYVSFSAGGEGIFRDAVGENKFAANYGGGLKVKMSRLFGLRFDIRDRISAKPNFLDLSGVDGRLHSIEYSVGFSALF